MDQEPDNEENSTAPSGAGVFLPAVGLVVLIVGFLVYLNGPDPDDYTASAYETAAASEEDADRIAQTNFFNPSNQVVYWKGRDLPTKTSIAKVNTGTNSNVRRVDYAGSESCAECHRDKYGDWQAHSHRKMNALATSENVLGDFSGTNNIRYQGGVATFFMQDGEYHMKTEREDRTRHYRIMRTIGSRFFQYYTGKLIDSSQPEKDDKHNVEHVLPFGFWVTEGYWVPTVHVLRESHHEHSAMDLFAEERIADYDYGCSGDWMLTSYGTERLSKYSPRSALIEARNYIENEHPQLVSLRNSDQPGKMDDYHALVKRVERLPSEGHRLELGIGCEACHNGAKEHVANSSKTNTTVRPWFFPVHPQIHSAGKDFKDLVDKSDNNANLICARCHTGGRPEYANGIHTWNSTEFADGTQGFCYKRRSDSHADMPTLTCVHCHDPHEATGPKWKRTPEQNDRSCIDCHQQFKDPSAVEAHTHHKPESAGSRCMDCHMPKINEGLEYMVRTHRIFNPTDPKMIEANQPNACNLCHLDKPIDWTIDHLRKWYGEEHKYAESRLFRNYPKRKEAVGANWLDSPHHPTRLAAAHAMTAPDKLEKWLPELIEFITEDTHLINRQFIQHQLDQKLGIRFRDKGFNFYMPKTERRAIMAQIRSQIASGQEVAK